MSTTPFRHKIHSLVPFAIISLLAVSACGGDGTPLSHARTSTPETEQSETPSETAPVETSRSAEAEDPELPTDEELETYVMAMASSQPDDIREAETLVAPGSPAEAYLRHIEHSYEAERDGGLSASEPARVTEVEEGFQMCLPQQDECVGVFKDFIGDEGLIYSFSIDDRQMEDVVTLGDGSVVEGPGGSEIEFVTAYENAAGTHLIFNYILRSGETPLMPGYGSYRSPSGRQSQVELLNGTMELMPHSMSHYSAFIPRGELGGELHLDIRDANGYSLSTVTVPSPGE